MIKCNFTSYLCKIGSIDKYSTLLYHLVHIKVKYNLILQYRLHYIPLKIKKKPEIGSCGRRIMSHLILMTLLNLLMVNKIYISNTSKLLYSPFRLFRYGKGIGEISNFISY